MTTQVDAAGLSEAALFTRGPVKKRSKQFDRGLYGMSDEALDAVVANLVKAGLPPKPAQVRPLVSPERENDE
jgi:hypothetical protein